MKRELADGEAPVGTPFALCEYMRTVESWRSELEGDNEDNLFKRNGAQGWQRREHNGPRRHAAVRFAWADPFFEVFLKALLGRESVLACEMLALVHLPLLRQSRCAPTSLFVRQDRAVVSNV